MKLIEYYDPITKEVVKGYYPQYKLQGKWVIDVYSEALEGKLALTRSPKQYKDKAKLCSRVSRQLTTNKRVVARYHKQTPVNGRSYYVPRWFDTDGVGPLRDVDYGAGGVYNWQFINERRSESGLRVLKRGVKNEQHSTKQTVSAT